MGEGGGREGGKSDSGTDRKGVNKVGREQGWRRSHPTSTLFS